MSMVAWLCKEKVMKRRVVVTGLGALTPIGNNVEDSWQGILNHQCGIDFIQKFDTAHMKVKVAGELKNFEATDYLDKKDIRKMDPFIQYGLIASHEAIKDAKLDVETIDHDRFGVVVSSGIGGLGSIEENHNRAGGTNAIGDAFRNIRDGYLDVALAGGCEASITPLGIGGFTSMKALSESSDPKCASIPFDKERNGFVMGEGAGILVLEELEHAKKRGAPIYCEMVGYGVSCDAYHMTAPAPEGIGGAKAMIHALKDASIKASQIDYINAHGTSTPMNDKLETAAIKKAFGEHAQKLAVSSTKGNTGHCLGAAGGIEGVFCVKALDDNFIPATINYQNFDEECDLDIVANSGRKQELHYVMSNSLGFGGHNASIIFKKYGEE